jgi:hypothetical protein
VHKLCTGVYSNAFSQTPRTDAISRRTRLGLPSSQQLVGFPSTFVTLPGCGNRGEADTLGPTIESLPTLVQCLRQSDGARLGEPMRAIHDAPLISLRQSCCSVVPVGCLTDVCCNPNWNLTSCGDKYRRRSLVDLLNRFLHDLRSRCIFDRAIKTTFWPRRLQIQRTSSTLFF